MTAEFNPLAQRPGVWCWFELATHDTESAKPFYGTLFGWTYATDPMPDGGSYTTFSDAHGPIGGLYPLDSPMAPKNVPPHWSVYAQVESADAVAAKARELGGSVMVEPFDVMQAGRMAVLCDPEGAVFQAWQPKKHPGGALDYRYPGRVCWVELFSRDRESAAQFYSALFGWEIDRHKESGYWTYALDGVSLGGMLDIDAPHFEGVPARWVVYFAVADVDASVEEAKRLGGSIHRRAEDLPGVGRFAVAADPQNADFTLFRLANDH